MKQRILLIHILIIFLSFSVSNAQNIKPHWIDFETREKSYPPSIFFTGYVEGNVHANEDVDQTKKRLLKDAQAYLVESIRTTISSSSISNNSSSIVKNSEHNYQTEIIKSSLNSDISTKANAEVVGIKIETYYDASNETVYAFAYVNKYELIGYYKSNLSVNLNQVEGFLQTAQTLEIDGEKVKARQQCESAISLFSKVRYAQDLLTILDSSISTESLQLQKTEYLYRTITQMQVQLAQGIHVYIESNEDLFGEKVNIVVNKVKGMLAKNGCSFVDTAENSDYRILLNAKTRKIGEEKSAIVFCYGDIEVELYCNKKKENYISK